MLFVSAIIAIMVGSLSSMREIVKEMEIYRRERMVSLQMSLTFCQRSGSAYWCLCIKLLFSYCSRTGCGYARWAGSCDRTLHNAVLATLAGMMLGLLVSAVSPNQNVAPLLILIHTPNYVWRWVINKCTWAEARLLAR